MIVTPRVKDEHIAHAVAAAKRRFPDRAVVLLHDDDGVQRPAGVTILNCKSTSVGEMARYPLDAHVFVYACNWSHNGLRFVRWIAEGGGFYFAVPVYWGGDYVDQDPFLKEVLDFEFTRQTQENYSKFDPLDFMQLCQALERTRRLDGDYLEIGCFEGSSGSVVLNWMGQAGIGRRSWFLDVFEGFIYDAARTSSDAHWVGGHSVEGGLAIVEKRLKRYERADIGLLVEVRKNNIITDDLPAELGPIVVANIDVDMYEAVLAALLKTRPRLIPGGIMMVEDTGHTPGLVGALHALEQFMEMPLANDLFRFQLTHAQTILVDMRRS